MNTTIASRFRSVPLGLLLAGLLLAPLGCSISDSSESSSKSLSDSSDSSSGSSSPDSKASAYRDDVRDYTVAYVKSGGAFADFKRKLGNLARERGVTNWEENMATYEGIGQGLGKANVGDAELSAYVQNLAGGDSQKADAMRKGYQSTRA